MLPGRQSSRQPSVRPDDDLVWGEVPRIAEPLYGIEDRPEHWWEALLYGWQVFPVSRSRTL